MEATLQSPFGQTALEPGVVTIGSTPDSRLVVHDAKVSPHHAVLRSTEQGYTITDWGSTEGTFVNDQRLEPLVPRLLRAGDRLRIGEPVFTYDVHEGAAVLTAPSESTAPGAGAQSPSAPLAQTQYGSVLQQFTHTPSQQPDVSMDTKVESEPLPDEVVRPSKPVMDHCQNCNAELPAGAHFCGKCGFIQANEAGPDEEAARNQASALTHTPPQQPDAPPAAPSIIPAYGAPPPQPPYMPPPPQKKPPKGKRWEMPRRWRLFALIALIILLVGVSAPFLISWAVSVLPGATATVTITPTSQHLAKTYTIYAVTGTPDASQNQVQARVLSFTAKAPSKTAKATGQGHQDATQAQGKVTVTPSTGTVPTILLDLTTNNSGVEIEINVTHPISSGSETFNAWAKNPGSGGNIAAYDLDGSYYLVSDPSVTFYLQNTQAFTGGQDAHDYTFVQQSDIDSVATPLVSQLTSAAQAAVQQQVRANEQFASAPECTPNIKTNHNPNDRVSDVTVTVTVNCKGEVYDEQAAQLMASDLLRNDAASQPGAHYALVGNTVIGTPQVVTTDQIGVVTLNVSAEGIWVYQFSDTQKQQMAQLIAGKPLTDARDLLDKQEGVKKVILTTDGGWGSAVPTSPSDIKFNVLAVPGLQATP